VKRSVRAWLGAAFAGIVVLAPVAACTAPPKPAPPKISWGFSGLSKSLGSGVFAGQSANFNYRASGVPRGGHIVLQKGALSGGGIRWSRVSELQVSPLGSGTILRPPFGRNTYRLAVLDSKGKALTGVAHGLDVYKSFTLSELTSRAEQQVAGSGGFIFKYIFTAAVVFENTSCRTIFVDVFNKDSNSPRKIELAEAISGKSKTTTYNITANPSGNGVRLLFGKPGRTLSLGQDFDLHVLDNANYPTRVYGNGDAFCLTDTGEF
jgi:hypothetical protein